MTIKKKIIFFSIIAIFLLLIVIVGVRLIGRILTASVDQLQDAGEASIDEEEGIWLAPTISTEDYLQQEAEFLESMPDPESSAEPEPAEDVISVPILETPEELTGTADESSVVDEAPSDNS